MLIKRNQRKNPETTRPPKFVLALPLCQHNPTQAPAKNVRKALEIFN